MPGGAALVAIGDTEHPEEVARVMEYLASEEVLGEFSARTLFIPAHLGLAEKGVDFDTDLPQAKKSLDVFVGQVPKLSPIAIDLQAYPYNRIMFNATRDRITQVLVGELTLDEAIQRSQEDIDQALAEEGVTKEEEAAAPAEPGEEVELRMTWYTDGNEDVVMRDLLDRFEAENPNIKVVMDTIAYDAILENLPIQLAAGEGPDMARVTDLGGLSKFYLDLKPYLSDPAYWEESFGTTLPWLRQPGDTEAIHGFQTQLTITGPFINRTLFEQAGVPVPSDASDEVTWEEWAAAAQEVAEALDIEFPMAMDRSGHRLAGPAISQGAKYFDENGYPAIDDEGFRDMAELFVSWHQDGIMPMEIWAGTTGYAGAN
jgi:ABC-type glycerol-3-phosphate transport system substrate-binding protein